MLPAREQHACFLNRREGHHEHHSCEAQQARDLRKVDKSTEPKTMEERRKLVVVESQAIPAQSKRMWPV